jgi:molecular chaperone DnaK (HSP70)
MHTQARAGAAARPTHRLPRQQQARRGFPCVARATPAPSDQPPPSPPPPPPPTAAARPVVAGIDLGTCNSAIAIIRPADGRPAIVLDRESGGPTTPSWVAVDPATLAWRVGERARAGAASNSANTFPTPKRLLGRKFRGLDAAAVSGGGAALVEAFDGGAEWWCPARGEALPPDAVAGVLLAHLLARAGGPVEKGGAGRPVSAAVITVPARHSPAQLAATEAAAAAAGLTAVRLIPEPVAAAVAYGIGGGAAAAASAAAITDALPPPPDPTTDATVLVVDVGGGTTDVAVVDAFEGMLEVLAAGGDARLGGGDWDAALADWLAAQHPVAALLAGAAAAAAGDDSGVKAAAAGVARMIGRAAASVKAGGRGGGGRGSQEEPSPSSASSSTPPPPSSSTTPHILHGGGSAALGLRAAAEAAKVALSSADSTDVELRLVPGGPAARVALSRARFDALTAPLVDRVVALVEATAAEAGVELAGVGRPPSPPSAPGAASTAADLKYAPPPRTITHAILVGGGSRVPALRAAVARLVGLEPSEGIDPEACVALGAAAVAAALAGDAEGGAGFELADGPYSPASHGRASGFGAPAATA